MNISSAKDWYRNQCIIGQEDPYVVTHLYLDNIEADSVFVEIGSDRFVGSTQYYSNLAKEYNTVLHSVDISTKAQERIKDTNIIWHTAKGSEWAKYTFPMLNKKISMLSLDNYDYIWDADTDEKRKSNTECELEHFKQLYNLYPYLTDNCVVVLDDTYKYNGCWIGKSGPGVVFLIAQGFDIKWEADFETNKSYGNNTAGVVMKRNRK